MKKLVSLILSSLAVFALTYCTDTGAIRRGKISRNEVVSQVVETVASQSPGSMDISGTTGTSMASPIQGLKIEPPMDDRPVESMQSDSAPVPDDRATVDLSQMNGTMAYAQIADIFYRSKEYVGKVVRIAGIADSFYASQEDKTYYAVLIQDATACCATGFDYILSEGQTYPEDGARITITGVFELYEEDGMCFCRLENTTIRVEN